MHFNFVALVKGDCCEGVWYEGNSFPSWCKVLPFVFHHDRLHSVETSEGTFLKRSKVSAVGLGALSEYKQL